MFESLSAAPPDPILGIAEAFRRDPNPDKINLSVGQYKNEAGETPVLDCVRAAEQRLLESETTKGYLGIDGLPELGPLARKLLFGGDQPPHAVTVQAPGGTGALRVAADFLAQACGRPTVWFSKPTWGNHLKIFAAGGLAVQSYAYSDAAGQGLDFDAMTAALDQIPAGDVVVLHACCHNPSGIDPTTEQWSQIAAQLAARKLIPLIDFAYQGFGNGLEEDAAAVRAVAAACPELLICSSFSKNFSLYSERVGTLTVVTTTADAAAAALSQVKVAIRSNYSNPPRHGAAIAATILADDALRAQWEAELAEMRTRILAMRNQFVDAMQARGVDRDFSFLKLQRGMFSFSGLTPMQVDQLRTEHAVYAVGNGRINVAGMTPANLDRLCDAVAAVL